MDSSPLWLHSLPWCDGWCGLMDVHLNRRDDQIKLFLPEYLSWQCSTGQTGGDDRSDWSSTGLHRWHQSDWRASPVRLM
jgi:hypothetical protein